VGHRSRRENACDTKVRELYGPIFHQKHIQRLNVAMEDSLRMEIIQAKENLRKNGHHGTFVHASRVGSVFVKDDLDITAICELHCNVEISGAFETFNVADNIWMVKTT
jgi:hypothetical protein